MTYRVVITAAAKQNLRTAYLWAAARRKRLHFGYGGLRPSWNRWRTFRNDAPAPENALVEPEIRQLIFGRRAGAYRALFVIVGNEIRVLHIRRAARDLAKPEDLGT